MALLPQFLEEDIQALDEALRTFMDASESGFAMIIDKAGFSITHVGGENNDLETSTLGALAAAAFAATQGVADLLKEPNFNSIYYQGENESLLGFNIDENCLMIAIFSSKLSAGAVKYYAKPCCEKLAETIRTAHERDPSKGVDLSKLNLENSEEFFRQKTPGS